MSFNINIPFQIPNLPSTNKKDHFEEQVRIFNAIRSLASEMANYYSTAPSVGEDMLSHGTIYVRCAVAISAYRAVCLRADPTTGETVAYPGRNVDNTTNGEWTLYLACGISLEAGNAGDYIGIALFGRVNNVPCSSLGWTGGHTLYQGLNTTGAISSAYNHNVPIEYTHGWDGLVLGLVIDSSSIWVGISSPAALSTHNRA